MNYQKIFLMLVLSLVMAACSQSQPLVNNVDLLDDAQPVDIPLNDELLADVEEDVSVNEDVDVDVDVAEDVTSDWDTYRNEEIGFEFKYPNGWNLAEQKLDSFSPAFSTENNIGYSYYENVNGLIIPEWVKENDFFGLEKIKEEKERGVDSYIAYGINETKKLEINNDNVYLYHGLASGGGGFNTAIISHGNKIVIISSSFPFQKENAKEIFVGLINDSLKFYK